MSTPTTSQPAGWYPDPQSPAQARYWDGQQWTGQTQPIGMVAQGGGTSPAGGALGGPGLKEGLTHEQREARDRAQSRGKALTMMLGLSATIMAVEAVTSFMLSTAVSSMAGAELNTAMSSGMQSPAAQGLLGLPLLFTALLWVMWQFAAVKTLGMRVAKGPGWHAGAWFIPIAGIPLGIVNMFRIRRATSGSLPVWAGWATCFVVPLLIGIWGYLSMLSIHTKSIQNKVPVQGTDLAPLVTFQAMGSLIFAVGALLAIVVVRHTTAALSAGAAK